MESPRTAQHPFGGGRMTVQRSAIIRASESMGVAFAVDELVAAAREIDPSLGVATVYRAVQAMELSGWLERVGDRGGSALYARCSAGHHHHHVICTECGRVEAAECPLGSDTGARRTESGFVVTRHEVTLYGLCPACVGAGER